MDPEGSPLDRTIAREEEIKRLLGEWILGGRAGFTVKALASATGRPLFSSYKRLDPSAPNGLGFRELDACIQAEPAGVGAELLELLARFWGIAWMKRESAQATEEDLRSQAARTLGSCASAATQIFSDLADGSVRPGELEVTRPMIAEAVRQLQTLDASLAAAAERPAVVTIRRGA